MPKWRENEYEGEIHFILRSIQWWCYQNEGGKETVNYPGAELFEGKIRDRVEMLSNICQICCQILSIYENILKTLTGIKSWYKQSSHVYDTGTRFTLHNGFGGRAEMSILWYVHPDS